MCAFQRSSELVVIRGVARLSRIGPRLMFGPLGHATASTQALRGPSGANGRPADRRRHGRTPFNRRLPGLGGPQLLLASASVLVHCVGCNAPFWGVHLKLTQAEPNWEAVLIASGLPELNEALALPLSLIHI